jgi:predicted ATPase
MGYRLPPLIALNEPEASLHPSLLAPLARLIASADGHTRIWIVTHLEELTRLLHGGNRQTGPARGQICRRNQHRGTEALGRVR